MRILFFDTETNGLPSVRNARPDAVDVWPAVVQIAWTVAEWDPGQEPGTQDVRILESASYLVRPDPEMRWSEESARIHGVSRERALAEGVAGVAVFGTVHALLGSVDCVIAHNLAFDKPVLTCELLRHGFCPVFPALSYCTMDKTKGLCKLPTPFSRPSDPYKFPKLSELYTYLFGSVDGIAFHAADVDVECLVRCFRELAVRGLVEM
jgi:DNA polymerase III epsilon subunit-like protein